MATKVAIKNNHFVYGGMAYFRANAQLVTLGSCGEKKASPFKPNHLFVKDQVPAPKLDAVKATVVDIDYADSSASDILADVHPLQLKFAGGSVSAAREAASQNRLKLMLISMLPEKMERAINDSPRLLANLIDYGNDARVALQTWVILNAEYADQVKSNGAADVVATIKGITIGLNGATHGSHESTITVEPGATFGYLLGKFDWDASSKKKRTKIVDIKEDAWSLG